METSEPLSPPTFYRQNASTYYSNNGYPLILQEHEIPEHIQEALHQQIHEKYFIGILPSQRMVIYKLKDNGCAEFVGTNIHEFITSENENFMLHNAVYISHGN